MPYIDPSISWSLFPKFYRHLSAESLADLVRQVGLDTTNLVVREGYWVAQESIKSDLPRFMKAMEKAGVQVKFATAGFSAAEVVADPGLIEVLRDWGITEFRMGHFPLDPRCPVRAQLYEALQQIELLACVCERVGIRAVYQVHQDTLISSASAVHKLLDGLPQSAVGVELDPGNQSYEGLENWDYAFGLLGDKVTAAGIKDTGVTRDLSQSASPGKGWTRFWTPITEGVTNWHTFASAAVRSGFNGTFVFMPFYHEDNPQKMTEALSGEVAYLRRVFAEMQAQVLAPAPTLERLGEPV